jgi:tRNA U55 pseudouridine synthase TruB
VRSLAADLAEAVGSGGHLIGLQRTRAGPFHLSHPHTLQLADLTNADRLRAALEYGASIADAAPAGPATPVRPQYRGA